MRVLLIKMSSMGDVFHTFPALSDARVNIPDLHIDWVVEKSFAEIPAWHPVVDKVYPIELRKWRKSFLSAKTRAEVKAFFEEINRTQYDLVLDAQGLYKSLWVAKKIHAPIYGMDFSSAREPLASLLYQHKFQVEKNLHAITRLRALFSNVFNYSIDLDSPLHYGLDTSSWQKAEVLPWQTENYLTFLHGTTWETKCWPEAYWRELISKICQAGGKVVLPWGTDEEKARAYCLQAGFEDRVWVPEKLLGLEEMAKILKFSSAVVSVDTGLSHVAAALDVPMVILYRVTDPAKIGAQGSKVHYLVSPEAKNYVKSFSSTAQETMSLEGLDVVSVYEMVKRWTSDEN